MDGSYQIHFPTATTVAESYSKLQTTVADMVQSLEGECNKQLATWDSTTRDAYQVAKQKWDQAVIEMGGLMANAQSALMSAVDGYQQTEQQGTNYWESMKTGM
jgi:WXG100 family type VII secretion target